MTLIEVLIAGAVLVVGILALMGLAITAIGMNSRNKADSTAAMLTQAIVEQVNSTLVGSGTATLTDCGTHDSTNPWIIQTAPGGALVTGGYIDFSETSPPSGYQMDYVVCNIGVQTVYDVRWDIASIEGNTFLLTVAARPKPSSSGYSSTNAPFFAFPVNLRVFVGVQ